MTEWISVKERLPSSYKGSKCIVYDGEDVMFAYWVSDWGKWVNNDYGILKNISHWISLPEAPHD